MSLQYGYSFFLSHYYRISNDDRKRLQENHEKKKVSKLQLKEMSLKHSMVGPLLAMLTSLVGVLVGCRGPSASMAAPCSLMCLGRKGR